VAKIANSPHIPYGYYFLSYLKSMTYKNRKGLQMPSALPIMHRN